MPRYYQTPDGQYYVVGADYDLDDELDDDDLDDMLIGEDLVIGGRKKSRRAGKLRVRNKQIVDQSYQLALPVRQSIAAGATATITLAPQRAFRVRNLVLSEFTSIVINSINVGQDSQLIASGAMPASAFSNLSAQAVNLAGSTANLGTVITLNVTNEDGAAAHILGGFLSGPTVLRSA